MSEGSAWVNSLIGGIISLVLGGFVPLVPILGGGVAGYLQGGSRNDGVKVGVIAGLIAWIPLLLLMALAATILSAMNLSIPIMGPGDYVVGYIGEGLGTLLIVIAAILSFIYFVGFSALGGWLGNYVKYETDVDI